MTKEHELLFFYDEPFLKPEEDGFIVPYIFVYNHARTNSIIVPDFRARYGGGIGADHIVIANLCIFRQSHFRAHKVIVTHYGVVTNSASGVEHVEVTNPNFDANGGIMGNDYAFTDFSRW